MYAIDFKVRGIDIHKSTAILLGQGHKRQFLARGLSHDDFLEYRERGDYRAEDVRHDDGFNKTVFRN